jgi:hypothetical protein
MSLSARCIPVVQLIPAQSLAGIEPLSFRLELRHCLVELYRPALVLGFLGDPVACFRKIRIRYPLSIEDIEMPF